MNSQNYLFILLLSLFFLTNVQGQEADTTQVGQAINTEALESLSKVESANKIGNSAIKEEIQRYMGYEPLLPRYLSLSYDATMNTNVSGSYVDIGFLLFMLIPVLVLFGFWNKPRRGLLFMLAALFILSTSVRHSFILKKGEQSVTYEDIDSYLKETKFKDAPANVLAAYGTKMLAPFSLPRSETDIISGEQDAITYPVMIVLFLLGFLLLQERISDKSLIMRTTINFIFSFCFLWLMLGAGIIWYGYLMVAMGTLLLAPVFSGYFKSKELHKRILSYAFLGIAVFWIFISLVNRTFNYRSDYKTEEMAKQMLDQAVLKYQLGLLNKDESIDAFFPGAIDALKKINAEDESLIYRVGTIFNYFIDKNDRRVLHDSQLDAFYKMANHFQSKSKLSAALKASGYKYLLVDLNTYVIDKTPEQTLRTKYNIFLNFIYENPYVELMVTNRMLKSAEDDSTVVPGVFGDVVYPGSFAIYELK